MGLAFEAFVGDAVYPLKIDIGEIRILQDRLGCGPFVLFNRLDAHTWFVDDVIESVKMALIGGGMSHERALRHVELWVTAGRFREYHPVALKAVGYALQSPPDDPVPNLGEPPAPTTTTDGA